MPTHDSYTRWITSMGILCDYQGVGRSFLEEDLKRIKALEKQWAIFAHRAAFGCVPLHCDDCHSEENTMRALNCDAEGNPLDGGYFQNASTEF